MSTLYKIASERAREYLELPEELPTRPAGGDAMLNAGRLGPEWEHNLEWKSPRRRAALVSKMLRTSPILALSEELITGRVTSVRLTVKRSESTNVEAADALERWLGLGKYEDAGGEMSMSTDELIRHLMSARIYGHVALSESWRFDEGAGLYWCDLHRRRQESYSSYLVEDGSQRLVGIVQNIGFGANQDVLPMRETMFLVHRPDLGWFDGRSIFRSIFGHWRSQQIAYRLLDLAANRYAMPPSQGKLVLDRFVQYANGATGSQPTREDFSGELADMASKLAGLDSDSDSHLLYPYYWDFDRRGGNHTFDPSALIATASHHERVMAEQLAVAWIMQGRKGDGGSRSMVETQQSVAQDAVIDCTQWILNALNRQTIRRWLDVNYSGLAQEERPIVTFERGSIKTPFWMANPGAFADFVSKQIITMSPADEASIRVAADLPPPPEDAPDALDRRATRAGGRLKTPEGQRESARPGESKQTDNPYVNRLVERGEEGEEE